MTSHDAIDDLPLDPDAMLALADREKRTMALAGSAQVPWYFGIWGAAWLVGFLVLGLSTLGDASPIGVVPAAIVFGVLIAAGFVASTIIGIRTNRGIRGGSAFTGTVYGIAWPVLAIAFGALGGGLISNGMGSAAAMVYFPSAYALMVGALYLAGAALWRSTGQLVIGIVMIVVGAAAPYFGAGPNLFVMAFAGGGSLLIAGVVAALRLRARR